MQLCRRVARHNKETQHACTVPINGHKRNPSGSPDFLLHHIFVQFIPDKNHKYGNSVTLVLLEISEKEEMGGGGCLDDCYVKGSSIITLVVS